MQKCGKNVHVMCACVCWSAVPLIVLYVLCVFICSFLMCVCVCESSRQLKCLQGEEDNDEGGSGLRLREGERKTERQELLEAPCRRGNHGVK